MKKRPPKKKRLKKPARLERAKQWVKTYSGKRIVHGYAKHFGVDKLCAVKELRMIGIEVSDQYEKQLRHSLELLKTEKERKKEQRAEARETSDDGFAWIAGYTSWGFPYGITYEEMEENEANALSLNKERDDDLPF
jgi:hypothetical protein